MCFSHDPSHSSTPTEGQGRLGQRPNNLCPLPMTAGIASSNFRRQRYSSIFLYILLEYSCDLRVWTVEDKHRDIYGDIQKDKDEFNFF